jgi:hypothetical protein
MEHSQAYSTTDPFYSDTHPEAMKVWIDLLRKKSPGEKLGMVFEMARFMRALSEAGVRAAHPDADEREVFLRAASRRLDRDLMIRAYGWDPQVHGY